MIAFSFSVAKVIILLLICTLFSNISIEITYDQINQGFMFDNLLSPELYEQQAAASIEWLNYTKPNIHLKMQYPSEWKKVEDQNNITLLLTQIDSTVPSGGNLSIESYPSGNTALQKLVSLKILDYREHWPSFVLNNSITDTIGDKITAYKIVYTYGDDDKPYTVMELWTIIDGNAYVIRYQTEATMFYSNHLPIVEKVIDSIDIQRTGTNKRNTQNYPALEIIQDPYDVAVSPIKNVLYVTNLRYDTVSVIDGATDKLLADIRVGNNPEGVSARSDRNMIYVANSGSNTVSVIDGAKNRVLSNITVGLNPTDVATDDIEEGLDSFVFVANTDSNTVSVIDARVNKVISNITVGDQPGSIILNPVVNRLYVTNSESNTVSVIDYFRSSNQIFRANIMANISVGSYPVNLELDQDTNRLYVINSKSNTVSVIDGATNKVIDTVPVGITPYSITLDKKTDNLYVSNYGSNTVSIINASTNNVTSNIAVGRYPVNVELNPATDIVYVSNLGPKTLSEIKNTSLITGVEFNIHPPEAGFLTCNGDRIEDNEYIRYNFNSTVSCEVNPESDFEFGSWSGNLDFTSSVDPETTFKASRYGNVTANFVVPPRITLPEGYWNQLIGILLAVMIPTIIGWFVPSIAGWINGWRQRRNLGSFITKLAELNEKFQDRKQDDNSKSKFLENLERLQSKMQNALTRGKISESQYQILVNTVSYYQKNATI
jgi:YVTN family beta-propeller protein